MLYIRWYCQHFFHSIFGHSLSNCYTSVITSIHPHLCSFHPLTTPSTTFHERTFTALRLPLPLTAGRRCLDRSIRSDMDMLLQLIAGKRTSPATPIDTIPFRFMHQTNPSLQVAAHQPPEAATAIATAIARTSPDAQAATPLPATQ